MKKSVFHSGSKTFTLIELLVVIAITAILAAMRKTISSASTAQAPHGHRKAA